MKGLMTKVLTGLMLAVCMAKAFAEPIVRDGEKIAFLGDSITYYGNSRPRGFVHLVVKGLEAVGVRVGVIPAGRGGDKSDQMLARLDKDVLSHKPQWMLLSCGVNDVYHAHIPGRKGVPLEDYQRNMTEILDRCSAVGVKVILMTPTMITENPDDVKNVELEGYCAWLRKIAVERKLPLADLNVAMRAEVGCCRGGAHDAGNKLKLTWDGIHMTDAGDEMIAIGILGALGVDVLKDARIRRAWEGCAVRSPCDLHFSRIASRRFVLDNELPICQWSAADRNVENKRLSNAGEPLHLVGGFLPVGHYQVCVSSNEQAAVVFADDGGRVVMRFAAPFDAVPPYKLSVLMTCRHRPAVFITKGRCTRLAYLAELPKGFDPREQAYCEALKFYVTGNPDSACYSLSAGIGQADVRFVTTGREGVLYRENERVFFTFSARGYGAYQAVASFDPSKFDVRLESVILFDYGDGMLRNDIASHIFYDEVEDEWRAVASNFSTGADDLSGRAEGGLVVAWAKTSPLHGFQTMRAKPLSLHGMNEDPSIMWDRQLGKWRLFVSQFPKQWDDKSFISAAMLESESWDGPYKMIAGPFAHDSTGTTIQRFGGRKFCFCGSAEQKMFVLSYPDLEELGCLNLDVPPWTSDCPESRVWPCFGELPDGGAWKYLLLTMDRQNFSGMPDPNWTYGGLYLYGAN